MKNQHDIIIVGIQPWDIQIGSNCKNIALELSKTNRVLYVNSPLDHITKIRNRKSEQVKRRKEILKNKNNSLQKINDNLFVLDPQTTIFSINWLPSRLFKFINKINNKLIASEIKKALVKLNFIDPIIFNDSDMFRSFHLKELLNADTYVYYTRDNLMTVPYWKKHGTYFEPELIKKSDVVVGNSPHLINKFKAYNKNAFYIGQGCDFSLFNANTIYTKPNDLENVKGKIIGYTGLLSSRRLDIHLIKEIAINHPDKTIVLIGQEEDCFKSSELHKLENILFLGNKTPEELPRYISFFDICINPQSVNELTISNYPRKIDEYMALGKNVVATFTPTMEIFKDHVFLARDSYEFNQMIAEAITNDNEYKKTERINFALNHTWEASVNELMYAINTKNQNGNT
ncbi:MAG: glycosyltransferase [Sphingobacteriaceae bacterium]